jgi:hypothetical protein
MELHKLGAKWIRAIPLGLAVWTLYLNTADQPQLFGKAVHAVGPSLWIVTVEIAGYAVRKLVGLTDEHRVEGIRRALWVLRPIATARLWKAMRVHQLTTYREALDRDAARAVVVGRLRLHHGRAWRLRAPLAERIALRLDGRDLAGVTAVLRVHSDTAALLAGNVAEAVPEMAPGPVAGPVSGDTRSIAKPRTQREPRRARAAAKAVAVRRDEAALFADASALNARVIAQTGTPVSVRRLKAELHIGQPVVQRLRAALGAPGNAPTPALRAAPETPPQPVPDGVPVQVGSGDRAQIEFANGSAV